MSEHKVKLVTASGLMRNCGHPRLLGKRRIRTASQLKALDRGNLFQDACWPFVLGKTAAPVPVNDSMVNKWAETFRQVWVHRPGVLVELPLGLSPVGRHVEVLEPRPHEYEAADGFSLLLTAGRADIAWTERHGDLLIAVILDVKTGRFAPERPASNPQIWSLGLSFADRVGAQALRVGLYYARTGAFDWYPGADEFVRLDSEEAAQRWDDVTNLAMLDEEPRPGPWCDSCWEKNHCPEAVTAA